MLQSDYSDPTHIYAQSLSVSPKPSVEEVQSGGLIENPSPDAQGYAFSGEFTDSRPFSTAAGQFDDLVPSSCLGAHSSNEAQSFQSASELQCGIQGLASLSTRLPQGKNYPRAESGCGEYVGTCTRDVPGSMEPGLENERPAQPRFVRKPYVYRKRSLNHQGASYKGIGKARSKTKTRKRDRLQHKTMIKDKHSLTHSPKYDVGLGVDTTDGNVHPMLVEPSLLPKAQDGREESSDTNTRCDVNGTKARENASYRSSQEITNMTGAIKSIVLSPPTESFPSTFSLNQWSLDDFMRELTSPNLPPLLSPTSQCPSPEHENIHTSSSEEQTETPISSKYVCPVFNFGRYGLHPEYGKAFERIFERQMDLFYSAIVNEFNSRHADSPIGGDLILSYMQGTRRIPISLRDTR